MHLADESEPEPLPLPPPPLPRRLARGSAPWGVDIELTLPLRVREIVPSSWSRVVPLSLDRARRPRGDLLATTVVAALAGLAATFATLLLF